MLSFPLLDSYNIRSYRNLSSASIGSFGGTFGDKGLNHSKTGDDDEAILLETYSIVKSEILDTTIPRLQSSKSDVLELII